jgi:hypothetical protein
MPKFKGKSFPYTKKGKKAAKRYSKESGQKMTKKKGY